ncbi:hypothetical protein [Ascidiimonas sp. W6]|uniref:hypothetical protein n=1 Tax=Ascidiimonas meishanensis TaxID=3128903 RepID=UPI0030EDF94A
MKTTHFLFTLLISILLYSCAGDDEGLAAKTVSFKIKAISLQAPKVPDNEGGALEVFGTIRTKLVTGDRGIEHTLWDRDRDNFETVGETEIFIESDASEHIFTVTEEDIINGAEIEVFASMLDRDPDGNTDDFLGELRFPTAIEVFTNLDDDNNPAHFRLPLKEFSGTELWLRLTIEHIRE